MKTLKIQPKKFKFYSHLWEKQNIQQHSHLKEHWKFGKYSHLRYMREIYSHLCSGADKEHTSLIEAFHSLGNTRGVDFN